MNYRNLNSVSEVKNEVACGQRSTLLHRTEKQRQFFFSPNGLLKIFESCGMQLELFA